MVALESLLGIKLYGQLVGRVRNNKHTYDALIISSRVYYATSPYRRVNEEKTQLPLSPTSLS